MATKPKRARGALPALAGWGAGLLVMLADTDAGNVVVAAQAGGKWGYRLLPLVLALAPALFLIQEPAARLGLTTGRGFGQSLRERFGPFWAGLALAGLAVGVLSTLVTEFTGIVGVAELYGVSRNVALQAGSLALLAVAASSSYAQVERIALAIGLFECAFLYAAWAAAPDLGDMARQMTSTPPRENDFLFLAAAMVGAAFSPWMIYFHQAAMARRPKNPRQFRLMRWDVAAGAALTQILTGAVLVAAAAFAASRGRGQVELSSIGDAGAAIGAALGPDVGRLVFSLGVLGASLAAAIVASLALAWGVAETFGNAPRHGAPPTLKTVAFYALSVALAAVLVRRSTDLVWLNLAAQVVNALLFPLIAGLLILLAARLPEPEHRLGGFRLWLTVATALVVSVIGCAGAWGLFKS